jgi:hypothetical protein
MLLDVGLSNEMRDIRISGIGVRTMTVDGREDEVLYSMGMCCIDESLAIDLLGLGFRA